MRSTLALSLSVALGVTSTAIAQQPAEPQVEPSTALFSLHNSPKMPVAFSDHGNVVKLEAPLGQEHLRVGAIREGYIVCSAPAAGGAPVSAFDVGDSELNFGAASISQPNGPNSFPLTITRTATNQNLRLTQEFSRDTNRRDVTVTMTLTNLNAGAGGTRFNVRLDRIFDGDINNDPGDDLYTKTTDSILGYEVTGEGVMLTDVTFPAVAHSTAVHTFVGLTTNVCGQASAAVPTAAGDFAGRLSYAFGNIPSASSRQVTVMYRVF